MLEKNEASPLKEVDRLTVLLFFLLRICKETRMKEKKRMTSDLRPYEGLETKDDSGRIRLLFY